MPATCPARASVPARPRNFQFSVFNLQSSPPANPINPGYLEPAPMLSVIVPAHNEEQLLGSTLAAIQRALAVLGRPSELLVVDDASTDRTAAIAREHSARVIPVAHRQIAATRNAGGQAAQGDLLLFVDADTLVTPEAVRAAVAALEKGAAGGGTVFRFEGQLPFYARVIYHLTIPLYRILSLTSGCFLFCTRAAFQATGGFDTQLFAAEEISFARALRRQGRVIVLREPVTTSGRKLRTHTPRELLRLFLHVALSGKKSLHRRDGLDLWYGQRRSDPHVSNSEER